MPWFQSLLFEYKSSASSVVAEYKRVEVNILLVAVCSTFSIVKLVFGSFFNKTRWWLLVVKLSNTWKVLSCKSAFGLCYLTLKWYTKILLILHWFDADWTRMITVFDHLPFENAVSNTKWLKLSGGRGRGKKTGSWPQPPTFCTTFSSRTFVFLCLPTPALHYITPAFRFDRQLKPYIKLSVQQMRKHLDCILD